MEKTKFDIFLEKSEILKTEFKTDKESFLTKIRQKNESPNNVESLNDSQKTSVNTTDLFSKIISKEKMDVILDKFKNKNI